MEILETGSQCIIAPLSPKLDRYQVSRLFAEIADNADKEVGIDLTNVNECDETFFSGLRVFNDISLFNINSDLFAIINIMKLDKIFNIYVSKPDFLEKKHRLLNRKFFVVKT